MSFQERARLGLEELSNQLPVTLEMAKEQALRLKDKSNSKNKKKINKAKKNTDNSESINPTLFYIN